MPAVLVCPACRPHGPAGVLHQEGAVWRCAHCAATWPHTVAPVVVHPLAPFAAQLAPALLPPAELLPLAPWLADDAPEARLLQRVAVATRAHWGDRISPAREAAWEAYAPFLDALPGERIAELGCGAGRVALELARDGREVVALDSDPATLALGVSVRDRGSARGVVRELGATYLPATIEAPHLQGRDVTFVLGDALDPPLPAESFDAVVALNLLDNVRVPSTLIGQLDALLRPGGVALLSTPYAWDSTHTDDGERVGGAAGRPFGGEPEGELRRVLEGEVPGAPWRFEIAAEQRRVPYVLVRDERTRFVYDTHVVVAVKRG